MKILKKILFNFNNTIMSCKIQNKKVKHESTSKTKSEEGFGEGTENSLNQVDSYHPLFTRQMIREAGHCVYCFDLYSSLSEPWGKRCTYGKPEWACWDWDNDLDIPPNPCVNEWSTVKARSLYSLENWRTDLPDWKRKICLHIIQSHTTTAEDVPNTNNGHRWFNNHRLFDKDDNEKFAQHHVDYIEEWIPRQDQAWQYRPKWVGSRSDRHCISPQKVSGLVPNANLCIS